MHLCAREAAAIGLLRVANDLAVHRVTLTHRTALRDSFNQWLDVDLVIESGRIIKRRH